MSRVEFYWNIYFSSFDQQHHQGKWADITAGWGKVKGWWTLEAAEAAACKVAATSNFSLWINSSRFFICFRSLALLFWNQIFTWKLGLFVVYRLSKTWKFFQRNEIFFSCQKSIKILFWGLFVQKCSTFGN